MPEMAAHSLSPTEGPTLRLPNWVQDKCAQSSKLDADGWRVQLGGVVQLQRAHSCSSPGDPVSRQGHSVSQQSACHMSGRLVPVRAVSSKAVSAGSESQASELH